MTAEAQALDHLPWSTTPIFLGAEGVNLTKPIDNLTPTELSRGTNIIPRFGGGFDVRLGLTSLITGGANVHSAFRMNDPQNAAFTRFWGVDANFSRGSAGVFTALEAGFSGNPLSWVAWQSEITGTPWVYVADSLKMRKATRTGASTPIGLPKPAQPAVAVPALVKLAVAAFDASDGTNAAAWSGWSGRAVPPGTGNPGGLTIADGPAISGNGVAFTPDKGGVAGGGFYSVGFLPKILDLSTLGGQPVSDNDIFHIRMLMDRPDEVTEVRIYFVVGAAFASEAALPGGPSSIVNTSAYMRAFTPSEYSDALAGNEDSAGAAARLQQRDLLAGYQDPSSTAADTASASSNIGTNIWNEFGIIGLPVRIGDFLMMGSAGDPGFTWANVQGMVVAIFVNTVPPVNINVTLDDAYITGGGNPDTSEPDAQPYDYRVTNCSVASGAEGNPSDVMTTTVEALRQKPNITPVAVGNVDTFQRAYRRGGTLTDNWYFVGQNAVDGGVISDNSDDATALVAGAVAVDHDQPITTTDAAGNAVYNQPVPIIFGPIEDYMIALGDPYRPGDIYWCKKGEPDHWPAANHETACPPSEQLMTGGKLAAGQGFAFSRQRLYSITISGDGGPTATPTDCAKGAAGRYCVAVGPNGIFFVAKSDGVYLTGGSTPDVVSDQIRPLFHGLAVNGYNPVDWTQENALRLAVCGDDLWFGFQDTAGARVWWVYSILYKRWRFAQFAIPTGLVAFEPQDNAAAANIVVGGTASGAAYTHSGFTDDGTAITWAARTGAWSFGEDRAEKLLGDLSLWANLQGTTLSVTTYRNLEKVTDTPATVVGTSIYDRYLFDIFGTVPANAQSVSVGLSGTGAAAGTPFVSKLGVAVAPLPDVTMNRATTWQPVGDGGEVYLTAGWIDSDTGGSGRTVLVEGLLNGAPVAVATLTINSTQGRRQWFSWQAVKVDMIRLRPTGDCAPWMLYGQGWLHTQEPARIAVWDSGFETIGDSYYTGLDLEIDTFGANKTLHVTVDAVEIPGSPFTITANGRSIVHLTFTPGRGHIYRMYCLATDTQIGLLYNHKWLTEAEPGEQTNWNQNYTIAGTQADKLLKGFIVECDTFGQDKTVNVEIDGVVIAGAPFTVNANGRKVVQVSFAQSLGRVFRILPSDNKPSRLYSLAWIFDEEPYCLTRFETQEQPNGIDDWMVPQGGQIALKSTATVNMQVLTYGQGGVVLSNQTYALPSTAGAKGQVSLHPFLTAQKGVLIKFVFTSAAGFWLYREESWIKLQPWSGGASQIQRPFGNDDLDATRVMRNATLSASRSGGSLIG